MPVNLKIIILFQKGKTNPLKANATQVSLKKKGPCLPTQAVHQEGKLPETGLLGGQRCGFMGLDILMDDLGIYLKVLRSSRMKTINQDYADIVL